MKNKILISAVGVLLAFSSFLMGKVHSTPLHPLGSVAQGSEYHATTTNTQVSFANYRNILDPNGTKATTTPGAIGSIVITTSGTSPFNVYDATSTNSNGEWATTTLATFQASASVGTYVLDVAVSKGILIEYTGSASATSRASTTITFR